MALLLLRARLCLRHAAYANAQCIHAGVARVLVGMDGKYCLHQSVVNFAALLACNPGKGVG